MCGINGLLVHGGGQREQSSIAAAIGAMNLAVAHRGPDGEGAYVAEGIGLGHRRLAILDLSEAGAQPMYNEDHSLVLVFNGEIYNYRELMPELLARGHVFRSRTDSEVILHAYEEWGDDCVNRFIGMWAFAIWDTRKRRLFASRDRFGVKPFVYLDQGGEFLFSSEIAGIRAVKAVSEANLGKLHDYLAYGYRTNNGETFFAGINELPPAHNLIIENGRTRFSRYWTLPVRSISSERPERLVEQYRDLLCDAVRLRFRSDVPIALLQSGGLDSSAICRIVDDEIEAGQLGCESVTAFTATHPGDKFDESAAVRQLIATCRHIRSVEIAPGGEDLPDRLPAFVQAMGEPVFSTTSFAHWSLMHAVSEQGIKVVFNGQGADEALAGYGPTVVGYRLLDLLLSQPTRFTAEMRAVHEQKGWSFSTQSAQLVKAMLGRRMASAWRSSQVEEALPMLDPAFHRRHAEYLPDSRMCFGAGNLDRHLRAQLLHYGFNQILHYEDQSSMSHSVEIRSPFIDYRLIELAFALPDELKFSGGITKTVLRRAFAGRLPDTILNERRKIGFATPFDKWMAEPKMRTLVQDLVNSASFANRSIWHAAQLRERFSSPARCAAPFPAWRFINVEMWARQFGISNI